MVQDNTYQLIAYPGSGSAIVEACLTLAGLPFDRRDVDYDALGPGSQLTRGNALGQVPTLIMPDGSVMTESLAMVMHVHDRVPAIGLMPGVDDPLRPQFLRWLVFMVAAIYPTFTFGDDPSRWVDDATSQRCLKESTDAAREKMWRDVEAHVVGTPWFLGAKFSALDIFVTVMSRWTPRRAWIAEHCPKTAGVVRAGSEIEALQAVWTRNDP